MESRAEALEAAVDVLADDGLVAFPTETVWGLAARASSTAALDRLRAWKGRKAEQPIAILIAESSALERGGVRVSELARRLMVAFWPGPLTLVLPTSDAGRFAAGIVNAQGAVGIRCSSHPVAIALARAAHERGLGPITATSLNRSGAPAAIDRRQARQWLDRASAGRTPHFLEPGELDAFGEKPSTVLDLSGDEPRLLRRGALEEKTVNRVIAAVRR